MNLKEYQAKVFPGKRVYISVRMSDNYEEKIYGTAGNIYSADGTESVVRLDSGDIIKVSEKNVHLFRLEISN